VFHVLHDHYGFDEDHYRYLDVYTYRSGVTGSSTEANVNSSIKNWLGGYSTVNDIIFIYFSSHGGGYNVTSNELINGRFDDEGDEIRESTLGQDVNGDGNMDDWFGVDESMEVQGGYYWDDELAECLDTLSYAKLIFVRQGCLEDEQGCYGGGIIDDISAPKRIIMTATNETCPSYGNSDEYLEPGDGFSEWSERFIDALHGKRAHWHNGIGIVHDDDVDADTNNDEHVSMWEAWKYAWDHDEARPSETPWLDDNFNGEPTYIN